MKTPINDLTIGSASRFFDDIVKHGDAWARFEGCHVHGATRRYVGLDKIKTEIFLKYFSGVTSELRLVPNITLEGFYETLKKIVSEVKSAGMVGKKK